MISNISLATQTLLTHELTVDSLSVKPQNVHVRLSNI